LERYTERWDLRDVLERAAGFCRVDDIPDAARVFRRGWICSPNRIQSCGFGVRTSFREQYRLSKLFFFLSLAEELWVLACPVLNYLLESTPGLFFLNRVGNYKLFGDKG